jgi:RNA polymerase sigma-70 factor (ECF subfamily)
MPDAPSDEELMRAYCEGDKQAFNQLFARYAGLLMSVARRQLETEDQARDVVQETFVRLHAARHDFRKDARLRPWVMTIAMNLVREHWRRAKRRKTTLDDTLDARPGPVLEREPLETRQRAEQVRRALTQLPASQREVVELHWLQERPFAEVAEIVGTSEGAVRVRAHRAYKTLKELLDPELGNG